MNSWVNYKQIKTLRDLRMERARISREIYYKTTDLREDMLDIGEFFTVDYWMGRLTRQLGDLSSAGGWATAGYNLVSSLMKKKRKKKNKARKGAPVEEIVEPADIC